MYNCFPLLPASVAELHSVLAFSFGLVVSKFWDLSQGKKYLKLKYGKLLGLDSKGWWNKAMVTMFRLSLFQELPQTLSVSTGISVLWSSHWVFAASISWKKAQKRDKKPLYVSSTATTEYLLTLEYPPLLEFSHWAQLLRDHLISSKILLALKKEIRDAGGTITLHFLA